MFTVGFIWQRGPLCSTSAVIFPVFVFSYRRGVYGLVLIYLVGACAGFILACACFDVYHKCERFLPLINTFLIAFSLCSSLLIAFLLYRPVSGCPNKFMPLWFECRLCERASRNAVDRGQKRTHTPTHSVRWDLSDSACRKMGRFSLFIVIYSLTQWSDLSNLISIIFILML